VKLLTVFPLLAILLTGTLLLIPSEINAELPDSYYKDQAYSIKSSHWIIDKKISSAIELSKETLSGMSFKNSDAKKKIENALDLSWKALLYNQESRNEQQQIESMLENKQYKNSYNRLLDSDKQLYNAKKNLDGVILEIKEARDLQIQDNRLCFLFWCYEMKSEYIYSVLNPQIQLLESKLDVIENRLNSLEKNKNTIAQSFYQTEVSLKDQQLQNLENLRKQEQYEADRQEQLLQGQIRQERLEADRQEQLLQEQIRQEKLEADRQEQLLQGQIRQERLEADRQEQLLQEQIRQEKLEADRQEQLRKQQEYEAEMQEMQLRADLEEKERQRIIEQARTNPVIDGLIDGTLYYYIEPIPSYYKDKVPGIHEGVESIASSLERNFYGVEIRRTYNSNSADLVVSWVKDFGSSTLGHAIFKKYVEVELGSDNCWGKWQPYDVRTIRKVMWHEIGHSLGYLHSNDPKNIMYFSTSSQYYQDVTNTFALESGSSRWFSFCNTGAISFHAESSKSTDGFNVWAIPPDDPRGFSNNGGATYVSTDGQRCGKDNMVSITRNCIVGSGAYLHFKNKEFHTIYITFEMYDRNPGHWPEMIWDQDAFSYDPAYLTKIYNMFH